MIFIALRLKATVLARFPSEYCLSMATHSSQFLSSRVSRPCCYRSCSILINRPKILSQCHLALGADQSRRWLASSSKADKSKRSGSSRKINERGGIWIYIGWTILGLVGVDQALQYKQEQEDDDRRQMLAKMQLDADNASVNVADWDETLPTIFTCKILHVDPGLDGTKMLTRSKIHRGGTRSGINKNIKRGDIVEILEAGVGPRYVFARNLNPFMISLFWFFFSIFLTRSFSLFSQAYHLCRMVEQKSDSEDTSTVVGWYPIEYLERLD